VSSRLVLAAAQVSQPSMTRRCRSDTISRPQVEAWCQRDQRLALIGDHTDDTDAHILDLEWRGANHSVGQARAAVFSLIGSFAKAQLMSDSAV
jgi:hypothetical protein